MSSAVVGSRNGTPFRNGTQHAESATHTHTHAHIIHGGGQHAAAQNRSGQSIIIFSPARSTKLNSKSAILRAFGLGRYIEYGTGYRGLPADLVHR